MKDKRVERRWGLYSGWLTVAAGSGNQGASEQLSEAIDNLTTEEDAYEAAMLEEEAAYARLAEQDREREREKARNTPSAEKVTTISTEGGPTINMFSN